MAWLLLDRGANIEAKDTNGNTALRLAVVEGHKDIARLLLDRGADIEAKDVDSWTALDSAASCGQEAIARLLLTSEPTSRPNS